MLNKKMKRSLSCAFLLSAALCFMSTPEKAEAAGWNGISGQDNDFYYYLDGFAFNYGYTWDETYGVTYEHRTGKWSDASPVARETSLWANYGGKFDRYIGSAAAYGFVNYKAYWKEGIVWNGNGSGRADVNVQRMAGYHYNRWKNHPETRGVLVWQNVWDSPDGKTHWMRPGQTTIIQVDNFQDFPGTEVMLKDYVDINYIQLINNSGGIAKNYATNYGTNGVYETVSDVVMTHRYTGRSADSQWMHSQFNVTITGGDLDYRIQTYAESANGRAVGYNDSTETIKIDGTKPTGGWTSPATPNVWTNQNVELTFNPSDARSGVAAWSYLISTNNGASYGSRSGIIYGDVPKTFTLASEGKIKFSSDVTDNVMNYNGDVSSQSYWIDKTAPTANEVAASTTSWTNTDVTLSVNGAADALSGFDKITLPNGTNTTSTSASQVVSTNGNYTFAIKDIAGNITNKTIAVGNIDKIAPTANNVTASTTAWTNSNVTLTLTGAADALSGFSKIVLPDGTSTTSTSASYSASTNGTFTFKVYDNAGNVTNKSITVTNIDKVAPTVTSPGTIQNETTDSYDVIVSNVSDAGSGIDRVQFPTWTTLNGQDDIQSSWTTNSAASGVGAGTTYTYKVNRSAHNWEFGNYNVHVYVYDRAGNATAFAMSVHDKKDMTPPNVSTAGNDPAWTTSKTIVVSASDEHTGLTNITTPNGTTILNTGKGVVSTQSHVVNANGNFVYSATDKYGNTTSRTVTVSSVDTQAPTGTQYGNPTAWTNANFDMGIKDIVETQSGYDHATLPNGTTTTSTNPWQTISANGTYSYTLYDKVGNSKTYTEVVTKIDKAAPTGTITASPSAFTNGNVTLTLNASDTGGSGVYRIMDDSGVYTVGATDTFVATANGTYDFTVYDNAGNSKVVSYTVTNIDKTSPGLTVTQNPSTWTKGEVTLTGAASDSQSGLVSIRETNTGIYAGRNLIPNSKPNESSNAYGFASRTLSQYLVAGQTYVLTINGRIDAQAAADGKELRAFVWNAGWTSATSVPITSTTDTTTSVVYTPTVSGEHYFAAYLYTNGGSRLGKATLNWMKFESGSVFSGYTPAPEDSTTVAGNATFGVSQNGTYTYRATDAVGNVRDTSINVTNIDKTAPGKPTIDLSTAAWTNGNVTFTITNGIDSQSGPNYTQYQINGGAWTNYTGMVTLSANGNHVVNARTTDKVGWTGATETKTASIDKVAPTGAITASTTAWTNGNVTLTLNAADAGGSGVFRIMDNAGAYTNGAVDTFVATANGTYNFTIFDNVGNSKVVSYTVTNIDKSGPTANAPTANPTTWTNGNVTISLTGAADAGSGFKNIVLPDGTSTTSTSASYTAVNNGTYTFKVYDNVGNVTDKSIVISNIDRVLPTANTYGNPTAWTNANVDMGLINIVDANSGYDHTRLPNGTNSTSTNPWQTITGNGTYSFVLYDKAGNSQTYTEVVTKIDKAAPTGVITASPTAWTNGNVTLTLNAADTGGSGVYRIKDPSGAYTTGAVDTFTVSANGTYQFTVYDNAGNSTAVSYTVSNIDTGLPDATIGQSQTSWTKELVDVNIAATDSLSGVKSIEQTNADAYAGRNLAKNSNQFNAGSSADGITRSLTPEGYLAITAASGNGNWVYGWAKDVSGIESLLNEGDTFTVSFTMKSADTTKIPTIYIKSGMGYYAMSGKLSNEFSTVSYTGTWKDLNAIQPHIGMSGVTGTVIIKDWKIEKGTGTPWSPAPEDVATIGGKAAFSISQNGTYDYKVSDNAGNKINKSITISNIDLVDPTLSLAPSTTGWTNSNVLVTAVSTDSQSGALLIGQAAGTSENIVRMSDWNNYYGSAIKTAMTDDSISFTGSTGYDGIHLTSVAADEDYLLSFDITKESGNITNIGGHLALSSLSEVWIDGVKQSGSFAGGITYPNDSLTHHVVVRFNSRVATSDRRVFIQPNRGGTASAYEVTIANTSLITGDFTGGASAFFTITDNGTHTYRSVDAAGNSAYKEIVVGNIDKIAPDATVVANTTAWTNQNVTLSISASDLGVSGYYRTKLPNGAYTSATTFTYSVTGNGNQAFTVYDRAGNSKVVTYNVTNIDKTLPGGTIVPSTTAWTKGPITLTFSGTDAGGSNVDYVLDHVSNKTIGASDSYVVSSNGTYNFTVFDKAGNSKVVSYAVSNIDLTAPGKPTIDLSTAAWTNGNVTFTIIPGTDSQSGVAYTQYQIDGGAWTNYTGVVTISTNGKHVINARTTDNVGWTGVTETKTASIDKVVPTAGISVNTSWTNATSVAATLTASDADSGLSNVKYQLSGATTKAETTATTGDVITIANEGQTTITLVATDNVGQTTTTTKVVKIDRTAPVFTAASISNVTESGFDVTVTVTDGLSGVNNVNLPIWRSGNYSGMRTFPHTGQGNGTHTYHVDMADIGAGADYVYIGKHLTDNAGNSAFAGDASFKLDVTAPTLAISQADATVWTNKDVTVSSVSSDNFNGVEKLTIAGNSTTKTVDVFAKPKILSVSLASRSTVSYLISKGYDVTVDTTVTTLAQLSGYDIILSDGQAWSADKASLLNQAYAAGYRIFSTGNDTASGAIHPVTTSSAGSGSFTLTQYTNTSHPELGDYDNIMKYYDGAAETDSGQLEVTAFPSDTRVLATNTLYGTASLLYSVNNNGGKWIHLQGFGPHGTMSRRIVDELMLGTKATRQTYAEALTVGSNGTYTVTAEDFFGNQTNQTITVSNIDKTLPGGTITSSNTAFTNGNVTLTFAGTDAGGSGVDYVLDNASNKTIGASDSYVVSSNGTYNFTIYDKAGNSKAVSYTVSNIDKSAPNATIASNVTGWTNQNVILTVSPTDVGVSGYYRTLLPNGTYSTAANPTYTATGNGAQTFVIYDNAGNSTTVTYTVGNIDKTLPGGTIAPSTTAWTNADVTLTLNATDVGGSGVDRVMNPSGVVTSGATASFTATANGTFSFTVYDKAGNTKVVTYVVANIDKIKPVYTGNIAISNVTQDYFDVVITNVTDAESGMNRVQFPTWTNANGQDDLGDWWSTTEYKGTANTTTYTYRVQRSSHKDEFGLYNVHIYMFDNAGNYITATTSYVLRDQVFPIVDSITGNPTVWTNQDVTLTVNGHDEHTGVKSITMPDGTIVAKNSAKGANATANYTVSENGSYTFKITDMYDNVTTQTVNVSKIDKILPSATTKGNPVDWTNQNQTLTITGSDAGGSGFKQIKLPSGVIVAGSSATYTVSQNGSYSFVVYDNAGNSRTISEQVTKIDKEAPGGGILGNPVNWTNKDATLTLNAADTGGAGVKGVYLPNGTFVSTTTTASYVATQNGTYTFRTVDFAGNETSISVTVTKIDKVAPTVASVGGNPTQWTNQSQTLRVTGTDALSGVTTIKRPDNTVINGVVTDYTVHQNGGYVFTLTDAAGNSATYTVDVAKIDKGNPSQSSVNISVNNSQQ